MAVHYEDLNQTIQDQKAQISNMKEIISSLRAEVAEFKSSQHTSVRSLSTSSDQPGSSRKPWFASQQATIAPSLPSTQAPSLASGSSTSSEALGAGSIEHWLAAHGKSGYIHGTQPLAGFPSYPAFESNSNFNIWQPISQTKVPSFSYQEFCTQVQNQSLSVDLYNQALATGYNIPFAGYSKEDLFNIVGQPVTPQAV